MEQNVAETVFFAFKPQRDVARRQTAVGNFRCSDEFFFIRPNFIDNNRFKFSKTYLKYVLIYQLVRSKYLFVFTAML